MSTAKGRLAGGTGSWRCPRGGDQIDVSQQMSQSEICALLAEAVTRLVDGPFVLVATFMGGANALYVAARIPARVQGIILEASTAPSRPEDLHPPSAGAPAVHPNKPWATPGYVVHQMANRMRMIQLTPPDMEATEAIAVVREREIRGPGPLGTDDEILKPYQEQTFRTVLPEGEFCTHRSRSFRRHSYAGPADPQQATDGRAVVRAAHHRPRRYARGRLRGHDHGRGGGPGPLQQGHAVPHLAW
jgi:pimeloyl-ACP methyl ester carboxylesterase